MLILTRKPGESLYIGDNVKIVIVEIKGNQIRVGIEAPSDLRIYREEIYLQILEENRKAAQASEISSKGLDELTTAWSSSHSEAKPKGFGSLGTATVKAKTGFVSKKGKRSGDDNDGK